MTIQIDSTVQPSFLDGYIQFAFNGLNGIVHPSIGRYLLENPETLNPDTLKDKVVLKQGANQVYALRIAKPVNVPFHHIVIKKGIARNAFLLLTSLFRGSKARRAFDAARHLIRSGLDTPVPLGFLERRTHGLITECFYITEAIENCVSVKKILKTDSENSAVMEELLHAVALYAQRMHGSGMIHCDLNLANFLFRRQSGFSRMVLIDLNRFRLRKTLSSFARILDISRMYWKTYRTRFFTIYCNGDPMLTRWEWFFNQYRVWRVHRRSFKNKLKGK